MSYTVLIVEDDNFQLLALSSVIKEISSDICCYTAPDYDTALNLISSDIKFDMFFLDIYLDSSSTDPEGIKLAKIIRNKSDYTYTPIVFITICPEHTLTAINEIRCHGYLLKPFSKEQVKAAIDDSFKEKAPLTIRDVTGIIHPIFYSDLLYVYVQGHRLQFTVKSGKFVSRDYNMQELEKVLDKRFIRCHRSYIVNSYLMDYYDPVTQFIKIDEIEIPVGKIYYEEFKDRIADKTLHYSVS